MSSGGLKQDVKWRMARDEPRLADWGRPERVLVMRRGLACQDFTLRRDTSNAQLRMTTGTGEASGRSNAGFRTGEGRLVRRPA